MSIILNNHPMINDSWGMDICVVADSDSSNASYMGVNSIVISHPDIVPDDGKILK